MFRTPRLILRPPSASDLSEMCRLMGDPDVMRWFDVCRPMSPIEVESQLDSWLMHQEGHGYAPGLIEDTSTGTTIGHGGLARYPETEDQGPELIYLFDPACWGRGLATEFATGALAYGLRELGVERILSTVRPENKASVRVLEKAGMQRVSYWPEVNRYLYSTSPGEAAPSPGRHELTQGDQIGRS
jgi:ribosomal-protein-alanine N-acetyltransferase